MPFVALLVFSAAQASVRPASSTPADVRFVEVVFYALAMVNYFSRDATAMSAWVRRALGLGQECVLPGSGVGSDIVNAPRQALDDHSSHTRLAAALGQSQPTSASDVKQYLQFMFRKGGRRVIGA